MNAPKNGAEKRKDTYSKPEKKSKESVLAKSDDKKKENKRLTIDMKINLLNDWEDKSLGYSKAILASKYGIGLSTCYDIINASEKIRQMYEGCYQGVSKMPIKILNRLYGLKWMKH